jgi:hypothetical protein
MFPYEVVDIICASLTGADLSRLTRVSKAMNTASDTQSCWEAVFGDQQRRLLWGAEKLTFFRGHDCQCVSGYRFPQLPDGCAHLRLPLLATMDIKDFMRHFYSVLVTLNYGVLPFLCDYPVWMGYTRPRWLGVHDWHRPGQVTVTPSTMWENDNLVELIYDEVQSTLEEVLDEHASECDAEDYDLVEECDEGRECHGCGRLFSE